MRNLLEFARGSLFNWFFILGYFLISGYFNQYTEELPIYLAIVFLIALLLELWAIYYKARAVQYRIFEASEDLSGIFYSVFYLGIRIAIFSILIQLIFNSFGLGDASLKYFNYIILFLLAREGIIYLLMKITPKAKEIKKSNPYLETLADLILVFIMLFAFMFMETFMAVPVIDLSLPWYSIIFITLVFIIAFALFYVPFRFIYIYEEFRTSGYSISYLASIIGILYIFLSPLVYNGNKVEADFLKYLNNRPIVSEVSYSKEVRIGPKGTAYICEIDGLRKLQLSTVHSDYFDPCIQKMSSLKHLDLSNNRLTRYNLSNFTNLEYLDLSRNEISGINFDNLKNLKYLDLSYNPLEQINFTLSDLENLKVLNLEKTKISKKILTDLKKDLPNTTVIY